MPKRIIFNVSNDAHATITTAAAKLNLTITEYMCKLAKVKAPAMGRPWHKEKESKPQESPAIPPTPPAPLTDWSDPKYDRCATCGHTRAVHDGDSCGWDDGYGRVMCDCEGFEPLRKESRS